MPNVSKWRIPKKSNVNKYFKHPSSYIDEPCKIGEGTKIWHFSHIMKNAKIGKNCILGQNVHIGPNVIIGNNVKIQNNVSVYDGVELEDNVFCGPSCVFTNVINPRSEISRLNEFQKITIRKGATIGANATIVCPSEIGSYAFIGAGAVVKGDVPDYAMMVVPAKRKGWMSRHGKQLLHPDNYIMICPISGWKYQLNQQYSRIVCVNESKE